MPFARKNFCKLFVNGGYNDKKSRYTAHQISGRKSPAISLMKLCTGSEIQKPSMSAFSVPQAYAATGAAQPQSLSAAALSFIQIFSCGSPMRAYKLYYAEHLFVKRFWHTAAEKRRSVSDSRPWVNHLNLLFTTSFLSVINGCEDSCASADKQQSNPQEHIAVVAGFR